MTDSHAARELTVFRKFASVRNPPITADSIENRRPPEPDILCAFDGRKAVAFEMVELVDQQKIARRLGDKDKLERSLDEAYEHLTDESRARIPNARIFVKMQPRSSLSSRFRIVDKIVEQLLIVGPTFQGCLSLPPDLSKIVSLKISGDNRGNRQRPIFEVPAPSFYKAIPLDAKQEVREVLRHFGSCGTTGVLRCTRCSA